MFSIPGLSNNQSYLKALLVLVGAGLTALGYIHSPPSIEAKIFYLLFTGLMAGGLYFYHSSDLGQRHTMLSLSAFFLTVAGLRAFVGTAGIGTPKSTGQLGFLTINQIWILGVHLHHYYLGGLMLAVSEFNQISPVKPPLKAIFRGTGLGFIMDEMGIILTGATYYNNISLAFIIAVETLFLLKIYLTGGVQNFKNR